MPSKEHIEILMQAVESRDVRAWNKWRKDSLTVRPDLRNAVIGPVDFDRFFGKNRSSLPLDGVDLHGADLSGAQLIGASLRGADLSSVNCIGTSLQNADLSRADCHDAQFRRAHLFRADLRGANLRHADLEKADLADAHLIGADLREANLMGTSLVRADLSDADLSGALLERAILVETKLANAKLTSAYVYGISAWKLDLAQVSDQRNLRITPHGEPVITVDNLEVAQFVYLLLHNPKIRDIIDTVGQKGVLILGRFTSERKAVLNALRDKLRELGYVPIMFDFERPAQRDFTETIKTLAGLSRFIIADITNPKSSPLELQAIMPNYMIPFVPIIDESEEPFAMFRDLKQKYGEWVLDVLEYDSVDNLLSALKKAVIEPALEKADQLLLKKAEEIHKRHVSDYQ